MYESQSLFEDEEQNSLGNCKSTSLIGLKDKCKSGMSDGDDTVSMTSFKSATVNRPYKPKPKTQGANILKLVQKYSQ